MSKSNWQVPHSDMINTVEQNFVADKHVVNEEVSKVKCWVNRSDVHKVGHIGGWKIKEAGTIAYLYAKFTKRNGKLTEESRTRLEQIGELEASGFRFNEIQVLTF